MVEIASIKIGHRHRREHGDIAALAANIDQIGLLHPVVVRPDKTLIAGWRRIAAAKTLGWTKIPVTVVDLDDILRGEFGENAYRKNFTLSESVAHCRCAGIARAQGSEGTAGRSRASIGSRQEGDRCGQIDRTGQGPRPRQGCQGAGHVEEHAETLPNHREDGECQP
jgi:ParB family transcriptional regulator, chromosome partitioning protein